MLAEKANGALRRALVATAVTSLVGGCFPPAPTICGSRTLCQGYVQPFPPCFDLSSDPAHCGACDRFCPFGSACVDGACMCPAGESVCGFSCVELATDPWNCGQCGVACGAGRCESGSCVCDGASGITRCGSAPVCVDTSTDPRNCGACLGVCPLLDEACRDGVCACLAGQPDVCPAPGGPRGQSACVSLQADPWNCGTCGTRCPAYGVCTAGACGCPTGTTLCATENVCADLSSDAGNCGACGAACDGQCYLGTCQPSPPPEPPPCGGFGEPCCGFSCDLGYSCDGFSCG